MCHVDYDPDDIYDSPYDQIDHTCLYYEPKNVSQLFDNARHELTMFCLNCQGLRSKWDPFYNLLQQMGNDNHMFDVIGVTELFSMSYDECTIEGYHPL